MVGSAQQNHDSVRCGRASAGVQRAGAGAPIVDNARRHGDPVEVRIEAHGDQVVVDVESGGPVIEAGDAALLCEPFFRGEAAVMTAPGLGLGLAVARTVARYQGGDVHAHPRAGGGLVVRVELPRREAGSDRQ